MKNYLQAIRVAFSRELMRHLAARLGESENAVAKALMGMVPMMLCQLVIRTGEGQGREVFSAMLAPTRPAVQNIHNKTEVLALLGGGPANSEALAAGEALLNRLFGKNRPGLDGLISTYSGLRLDSSALLLRVVAAILVAGLARFADEQQLSAVRLSEELGLAKKQIYNWLPVDMPRWPGFRRSDSVNAPHAVWAAELARPYWVLVLAVAGAAVLALLVLGALAQPASRRRPATRLLVLHLDTVRQGELQNVQSTDSTRIFSVMHRPAAW